MRNSFAKREAPKIPNFEAPKKHFVRQNQRKPTPSSIKSKKLYIVTGHSDGYIISWIDMLFDQIIEKFDSGIHKIYKFVHGVLVLEKQQKLHIFCKR